CACLRFGVTVGDAQIRIDDVEAGGRAVNDGLQQFGIMLVLFVACSRRGISAAQTALARDGFGAHALIHRRPSSLTEPRPLARRAARLPRTCARALYSTVFYHHVRVRGLTCRVNL